MVNYIRSDLDFILAQIKIAEAHAAGTPLYGPGGLVPSYTLSYGLRTVDGTFNNLLPGQETWGSSNQPFPELLDPFYRPASTVLDLNGPNPGGLTAANYNPSNDPASVVVDSSLRTISNLIVDQTLDNPAAILKALEIGGVAEATLANLATVQAIQAAYKPFSTAQYLAGVVSANAHKAYLVANAAWVADPSPANTLARDAALALDTQKAGELAAATTAREDAAVIRDASIAPLGIAMEGDNVQILNVATDGGLSAPFNSWFTLFGQFFDHGLDLVNKGGSGTVYIPLQPDDPLYVVGSNTNFMVLTRATVTPGVDGIMGTADDVRPVNTTTPFVDQNQTYTSHPSHQVFLRQYEMVGGRPLATGHLIEGGGLEPGGMATWGEVKAQALMLGIQLTDFDVGSVPLLRTDAYGNFIPNAAGFAQIITGVGADGIPNTFDDVVVSGTFAAPINPTTVGAIRTNSAFLADIAHDAVPVGKIADGDITIGLGNPNNGSTEYDNELLDAHFIAGDGRVNENIGLTAVHSIFHSEHNRLAEHTKSVVLADAATMLAGGATQAQAVAFLNEWLAVDVAAVPANQAAIDALRWDGNRLFQAAKFGTEMQYQHLVFEDFARKIQPNIDFFVVPDGYHADINPSIVAEFAHVVYRFGHSMLTETVDRLDADFNSDPIGLIEAFLNPIAFDANHTVADNIASGDIIRGMTRQVGNEIDEFVTSALRNNLLGLPLDLATINLARGRDAGVPSLNAARREFYEVSHQAPQLKPYSSWLDFAANIKNEASVINFIAAYGTHTSIVNATTIDGKRDAAMALVFNQQFGTATVPLDRVDFLNSTGAWANNLNGSTNTGVDLIDLWIGGLAEKTMVGGGMLGATFNFVFEVQLEQLQDGDRFYYLQRLDGLHLLAEMENNTFAKLILQNADAGHLPSDVFSTPALNLEVVITNQFNAGLGAGVDPTGGSILTPLVIRNNPATAGLDTNYLQYTGEDHVLLGGTDLNDILIAGDGDDTLYGDGGNDRLEGGQGNDQYIGGAGDDIITDLFGDDIIRSGSGNDAINAGVGTDLVVADEGNDFVVLGADLLDETFLGTGNDYVLGSKTTEQSMGGEGDDWIEIGAWTGAIGDNFDDQFAADSVKGHDVFRGDGGFDEFIGEGGDDIWIGTLGRGKFDGMSGFDWATYKDYQFGVNADLTRQHFDALPLPPPNSALDEYSFVEAVSGSAFDDQILGSDVTAADMPTEGFRGSVLTAEGIALINGLQGVLGAGVTSFDGGNILLGGAGSDEITGRGGDDIIDGDKWLNVRVGVFQNAGPTGGTGAQIDSADSLSELVTEIFNGTYNPGQLRIVREILTADGVGDTDVAIFSDSLENYDISVVNGAVVVNHARGTLTDGVDTLRNIERLRFADVEIAAPAGPTDIVWNASTPGNTGLPGNGTIATLASVDANNDTPFTYSLLTGSSPNFAVSPGGTVTRSAGTMAQNTTYTLNVRSTDSTGASRDETFVIRTGSTAAVVDTYTALTTNDTIIYGNTGNDVLTGNSGNDTLFGQADNDTLNGGIGNDVLDGGSGADTMTGGIGNDTYVVDDVTGTIDQVIEALNGGIDTVRTSETYTLTANVENLVLTGNNNVNGTGNALANVISGNGSGNTLTGGDGSDTINGGGGTDTAVFSLAVGSYTLNTDGSDNILVTANSGLEGTDTLSSVEQLSFNGVTYNVVRGGSGNDANLNGANGAAGSQLILGLAGNDAINGGAANDIILGGSGDDTTTYTVTAAPAANASGRDIVDGGTENPGIGDRFIVNGNNDAEAFIVYSRVNALGLIPGLILNTNTEIVITRNNVVIAELQEIEEITINTGGGADTVLISGSFAPTNLFYNTITINDGGGDDTVDITGLESEHRIVFNAGTGSDHVIGDVRPQDVVNHDAGSDDDEDEENDDDENENDNDDDENENEGHCDNDDEDDETTTPPPATGAAALTLIGDATANLLTGAGADDVALGNDGDDMITTAGGADFINAGAGNDTVFAGAGNDTVFGEGGSDTIFGGEGSDLVNGGVGDDTVMGGAGADTFVARPDDGADSYYGDAGSDTLDMSAIAANIEVNLGTGLSGWAKAGTVTDTLYSVENVVTGAGSDTITASSAHNVIDTGAGTDTIVFRSASDADGDTILNFEAGDTIDVSGFFGGPVNLVNGTTAAAGQIAISFENIGGENFTVLNGTDGSGNQFEIDIKGTHTLTGTDFAV